MSGLDYCAIAAIICYAIYKLSELGFASWMAVVSMKHGYKVVKAKDADYVRCESTQPVNNEGEYK